MLAAHSDFLPKSTVWKWDGLGDFIVEKPDIHDLSQAMVNITSDSTC